MLIYYSMCNKVPFSPDVSICRYNFLEMKYVNQMQDKLVLLSPSQQKLIERHMANKNRTSPHLGKILPRVGDTVDKAESVSGGKADFADRSAINSVGNNSYSEIDFQDGRNFFHTWEPVEQVLGKDALAYWDKHKWDHYRLPVRPELRTPKDVQECDGFNRSIDEMIDWVRNLRRVARSGPRHPWEESETSSNEASYCGDFLNDNNSDSWSQLKSATMDAPEPSHSNVGASSSPAEIAVNSYSEI